MGGAPARAIPSLGFRKWVTTILTTTQVTQNVILLALLFIYRLKKLNPSVKGKPGSEYRLLTVALMLGNKFLDDNTYTNKTWAEVSGISVQEVHIMEVEFLSNMKYNLYASELEWRTWHIKLGRFWSYFDKASRAAPEIPHRNLALPTQLSKYASLPSPPASNHPSPLFISGQGTGPVPSPHPLSMPLYLAPVLSATAPTFEAERRSGGRKRSAEDDWSSFSAKRQMRSSMPAVTQPATMSYPTVAPTVPRLPTPNLSIPSLRSVGRSCDSGHHQLPLPSARAMSTIYPGSGPPRMENFCLGRPAAPNSSISGSSSLSGDLRRENPYPRIVELSPSSSTPPQSQNAHSPSYSMAQRTSPYKPVRGVNTLLVPPPSSSMHNLPQTVCMEKIHYQQLGRPSSERKTGIVPYVHREAWPQSQMAQWQWPTLPQPTSFPPNVLSR